MKKKLIAALCAVLCILLGTGAGYLIGQAEYQSRIDRLSDQAGFDPHNPPLITDGNTVTALAESYYRETIDPDGSDPRLAHFVRFHPQSGTWSACLMEEDYVLKLREGSVDYMIVGNSYDMEILAEDGTILSVQFGE